MKIYNHCKLNSKISFLKKYFKHQNNKAHFNPISRLLLNLIIESRHHSYLRQNKNCNENFFIPFAPVSAIWGAFNIKFLFSHLYRRYRCRWFLLVATAAATAASFLILLMMIIQLLRLIWFSLVSSYTLISVTTAISSSVSSTSITTATSVTKRKKIEFRIHFQVY